MQKISPRSARSPVVLVAAAAVLAGVFPDRGQAQVAPPTVGGECDSERYKALMQAGFAKMADDEFRNFLTLDEACRMYKRALAEVVTGSVNTFNPCIHPPYAALASKPPAHMSQREYVYFREVDRECTAFGSEAAGAEEPVPPFALSLGRRLFMGTAVLGSLIATLVASLNE